MSIIIATDAVTENRTANYALIGRIACIKGRFMTEREAKENAVFLMKQLRFYDLLIGNLGHYSNKFMEDNIYKLCRICCFKDTNPRIVQDPNDGTFYIMTDTSITGFQDSIKFGSEHQDQEAAEEVMDFIRMVKQDEIIGV